MPGSDRLPVPTFAAGINLYATVAILGLLASAAVPLARWNIKRVKERELHADLWEMRRAIDAYKDAAEKGGIQTKVDSDNYPPDLDTLVVPIGGGGLISGIAVAAKAL